MNELNKISNEVFLNELNERLKKGEIKVKGDELIGQTGSYSYFGIPLNINIGNLVNTVIEELKEETRCLREEKEIQEKQFEEYKKANLKSQ